MQKHCTANFVCMFIMCHCENCDLQYKMCIFVIWILFIKCLLLYYNSGDIEKKRKENKQKKN